MVSMFFAFLTLITAKSAVHEIEAGIAALVFVICLIGASVLSMLSEAEKQRKNLAQQQLDLLRLELAKIELATANSGSSIVDHLRGEIGQPLQHLNLTSEHTNALLKWIGDLQTTRNEVEI